MRKFRITLLDGAQMVRFVEIKAEDAEDALAMVRQNECQKVDGRGQPLWTIDRIIPLEIEEV